MSIKFIDNSDKVQAMLEEALIAGLYDAGSIIQSQTQENSRVATGKTKGSWKSVVDEGEMTATIGSPEENAIWEEFGTGEYALGGNGRKGGWFYKDEKGDGHFTYGKKPMRMLHNAFITKKNTVIKAFEQQIKNKFK